MTGNKTPPLDRSEQSYVFQQQAIMNSLPVVILLLDEDGKYLEVAAGEHNQLYLAKDELLGKRVHDVFPEETADFFLAAIHKTLKQKKTIELDYDLDVIKGHAYFHGKLSPMDYSVDGRRVILFLAIDVTEQKLKDQQLQHSMKMDAVGQLTGGIAHNLNNIQSIVIGNLDCLNSRIDDDAQSQILINKAIDASNRSTKLIKQLLTFSSHQHGEVMPVDINKIISIMHNLVDRSMTPAILIEHDLDANLWQTKMDPGEFENVLLNIIMNAYEAMTAGGTLTIRTRNCVLDDIAVEHLHNLPQGEYVILSIIDTGIGMTQDVIDKVLEPFFTTKNDVTATGLGLSVAYGFMQSIKGDISITSEAGNGSKINLYLPRMALSTDDLEVQDNNSVNPQSNTTSNNRRTETILVVDDEIGLLTLAQEQIEDLGYRVYTASNAQQALALLEQHEEIDLMFSDVIMPGNMSGYELAMKAVELRPGLKLLLASGYTADVMEQKGLAICEIEVLNKPYRYEQLSNKLREILDA